MMRCKEPNDVLTKSGEIVVFLDTTHSSPVRHQPCLRLAQVIQELPIAHGSLKLHPRGPQKPTKTKIHKSTYVCDSGVPDTEHSGKHHIGSATCLHTFTPIIFMSNDAYAKNIRACMFQTNPDRLCYGGNSTCVFVCSINCRPVAVAACAEWLLSIMAGAGKVRKFLQGCGLGDYEEMFLSNGFDDNEQGAAIDAKTIGGITALMAAGKNGHRDTQKYLACTAAAQSQQQAEVRARELSKAEERARIAEAMPGDFAVASKVSVEDML